MSPGSIVNATVTSVETYGIRLTHEASTILVLIPEVAWDQSALSDCRNYTSVGAQIDVKVLRYVPESRHYLGSIKQVHPETNPWRDPTEFAIASEWRGVVTHVMKNSESDEPSGYVIEIRTGVRGYLVRTEVNTLLRPGDAIDVTIEEVNAKDRRIKLRRLVK